MEEKTVYDDPEDELQMKLNLHIDEIVGALLDFTEDKGEFLSYALQFTQHFTNKAVEVSHCADKCCALCGDDIEK